MDEAVSGSLAGIAVGLRTLHSCMQCVLQASVRFSLFYMSSNMVVRKV